jgi:hypothetical protein
MVSILQDRRLQYLFLFKAGELERRRLDYWLSSALVEGMEDGSLESLLKACAEFVEVTKECPSCLEGFLRMCLRSWGGVVMREAVFDLLVCVVPTNFDGISFICGSNIEYRAEIMIPLREIFDRGNQEYVIALFRYYTRLLSRWATIFEKCFLVGSTPSPLYTMHLYRN